LSPKVTRQAREHERANRLPQAAEEIETRHLGVRGEGGIVHVAVRVRVAETHLDLCAMSGHVKDYDG
jgi:hypothetical protein